MKMWINAPMNMPSKPQTAIWKLGKTMNTLMNMEYLHNSENQHKNYVMWQRQESKQLQKIVELLDDTDFNK
jgi:hypothetical protein